MPSLSTGVRVVLCAAISILLIKVVSDRQQIRWHPKRLPRPEQQSCPGVVLGPEPRLDWPNWVPYADALAEEVAEAEEDEASLSNAHTWSSESNLVLVLPYATLYLYLYCLLHTSQPITKFLLVTKLDFSHLLSSFQCAQQLLLKIR